MALTLALLTTAALLATTTWWLRRYLLVVTVEGLSMEPTLREGDRVLVRRTGVRRVRTGQVVIMERPHLSDAWAGLPPLTRDISGRNWVVKRVVACGGDPLPAEYRGGPGERVPSGTLVLAGDNPEQSLDSRHYGPYPGERLLGLVLRRLPQR